MVQERGIFLIWSKQVCATEQGMVSKAFNLKQGILFHHLASSTGCVFGLDALKECAKVGDSTVAQKGHTCKLKIAHAN